MKKVTNTMTKESYEKTFSQGFPLYWGRITADAGTKFRVVSSIKTTEPNTKFPQLGGVQYVELHNKDVAAKPIQTAIPLMPSSMQKDEEGELTGKVLFPDEVALVDAINADTVEPKFEKV